MSVRLAAAAIDTYDALKRRPGVPVRRSDAHRADSLEAVHRRLRELIDTCRLGSHTGADGMTYVFWSEIQRLMEAGAFNDLLDLL